MISKKWRLADGVMYEISKEDLEYIINLIGNNLTWAQANQGVTILINLKEKESIKNQETKND